MEAFVNIDAAGVFVAEVVRAGAFVAQVARADRHDRSWGGPR